MKRIILRAMYPLLMLTMICSEVQGASGKVIQVPEKINRAATAAANRWKFNKINKRLQIPGLNGQHDVVWELSSLIEKNEKFRVDADVIEVLRWLLFKQGLESDAALAGPIHRKIVVLIPSLAQEVWRGRLTEWMAILGEKANGKEPWAHPGFHALDSKVYERALQETVKKAPRHNPIASLWLTAAHVAGNSKEGLATFTKAQKVIQKEFPEKAEALLGAVASSLAEDGVKAGLVLLLDLSDSSLALPVGDAPLKKKRYDWSPEVDRRRSVHRDPLYLFYQLLGWTFQGNHSINRKAEQARARKWLESNFEKVTWDPEHKRYFAKGVKTFSRNHLESATAVQKKFAINSIGAHHLVSIAHFSRLRVLMDLMIRNPKAVKDPDVRSLVEWSIDSHGLKHSIILMQIMGRLAGIDVELGARIWARRMEHDFMWHEPRDLGRTLLSFPKSNKALRPAVEKELRLLNRKSFAQAQKERNLDSQFTSMIGRIFGDDKIEASEFEAILKRFPLNQDLEGWSNRWVRWVSFSARQGRVSSLRYLLLIGKRNIASYHTRGAQHPFRTFASLADWRNSTDMPYQSADEIYKAQLSWLNTYESKLSWDPKKRRFTGAPSPMALSFSERTGHLFKTYGLVATGNPAKDQQMARKLFSEVLTLMKKNKKAATDPVLSELILALMGPGSLMRDRVLKQRLLVDLPAASRVVGLKVWSKHLESLLTESMRYRSSMSSLMYIGRGLEGLDRTLIVEAGKALRTKLQTSYKEEDVGQPRNKLIRGLALLFVGGDIPVSEINGLIVECEKLGSTATLHLGNWGQSLVKNGNTFGLRLMLMEAKRTKSIRANSVQTFEYLSGKSSSRFNRALYRLSQDKLLAKIDGYLKWLVKAESSLRWDPKSGRFKAGGKNIVAADPNKRLVAEKKPRRTRKPRSRPKPKRKTPKKKEKIEKNRKTAVPPPEEQDF